MIKLVYTSICLSMVLSQDRIDAIDADLVALDPDIKKVTQYQNCRVNFCAHGDDNILLASSQDGGVSYPTIEVPFQAPWTTPLIHTYAATPLTPLSVLTKFRFNVTDSCAVAGGFIASIILDNGVAQCPFVTKGPGDDIENVFDVWSSDGITTGSYVYDTVGTGAWGDYWTAPPQSCLNWELGMEWVWNGELCNTMTFEFGFDEATLEKYCDPIPTPKPTQAPTEEPSVAPTQCDFCDISLEEYLDTCYCPADTTDPTGCGGFEHCISYFDGCNSCSCTDFGLVCTKIFCPRDEYEEEYCTGCEPGFVINSDHECVPIGSAQSINPYSLDGGYSDRNSISAEFRKIHEIMGYQNNLIYGLIGLNLLTIMSIVCVCSCRKSPIKKRKGYGGIEQQESDVEDEIMKA